MNEKYIRVTGILLLLLSILIYEFIPYYRLIAFMLLSPALILIIKNKTLSAVIINSIPRTFIDNSYLQKADPLLQWIHVNLKKLNNVHEQSAVIALLYGFLISLLIAVILLVIFIFFAFIFILYIIQNSNKKGDTGTGSISNSHTESDDFLIIEVMNTSRNTSSNWGRVSSIRPNENINFALESALRHNPNCSRARAIGNKTGHIYDMI